mmetsp:Transcript_22503/g.30897  ORF Transcript_22503/g.30897 Transcript_22503/m.30897 type:complete len:123 (+) Transcript_22503:27-395(+)|eukprot:CAMPEP_0176371518 /NCGR_PEP_ID=MMETSP0126-20121128/24756_1 /TAXON_ID=141414 ORGANISM="Strombidinopsis acuminatum, Strain SPMC142" /NCGR_SAMPLE_ID=MMETSP0126 /ASSEMBLY_ACC=CAM_ASM_000229 /LENGTH=122 /DNA_ID=CAMNT_0017731011 /DNA_START=27 /DNA_END=395 /DNA_ORIENTATION=-
MKARYEGKVCLVTGGTQGIGFGIAERMAKEGANVVICSRKEKNVNEALEKLKDYKVIGMPCNVAKKEDREKLLALVEEKFKKLDILVPNVAASTHFGPQMNITEKAYDRMWDINVKSTFFLI